MKTKLILATLILLFVSNFTIGQTPEQQKQIEKAMRMQDSIMKLPQYKDMMQQMKDMEKMQEKQQKQKEEKKVVKTVVKKTNSNDDWYWKNTIASTNNKFENWNGGEVDITMGYRGPNLNTFKVGTIKADGKIVFSLPSSVSTKTSMERQLGPQGLFYDIYGNVPVNYNNKEAGFITNPSLPIIRNGKHIGNLTIGNSVRVPKNLTSQSTVDAGDEGYMIYWAYANEACGITLDQNWKGNVRKDGTNSKEVETNVIYRLNFKPGWNLIKTEVIGKYRLEHERGLDMSWFKTHKHTVIAAMPSEAIYFFRAYPEY